MTIGSIKANVKAWLTFAPTSRPRKMLRKYLFTLEKSIHKHPKVEATIYSILNNFPKIKERLLNVRENSLHTHSYQNRFHSIHQLSKESQKIHHLLIEAMKQKEH